MAYGPFSSWNAAGAATVTAFGTRAIAIAVAKTSYVGGAAAWSAFLKAIGCNWLVNLAILLGICADDLIGKFFGIWFPIMAFVSTGFEHSIANMYFIPAGIFTKGYAEQALAAMTDPTSAAYTSLDTALKGAAHLNWVTAWTQNLIVVTIGNIIGAFLFVAVIYWVAFRKEIAALK
jgi:formate/nitrite transporter FocA (FNT family)